MKQGTLTQKITMMVLLLAVVAYLVGAAARSMQNPYSTVMCYAYTLDDAAEATGLLVRQEMVVPGQGGIVDVLPDEGEKVGAGQAVALVYRDEAALGRKRELKALTLEAEQLNYSIQRGDSGWDSKRLDESIIDAMEGLKYSAGTGDLTALEDQCLSLKSLVLSREATYGSGAAGIAERAQAVSGQLNALSAAASMDTSAITVAQSGVFSNLADGYEPLLTPQVLSTLTPAILDGLMAQQVQPPAGAVGKLITGSKWYFAVNLPEEVCKRLMEAKTVTVRFSRDWSGEVRMAVDRISAPHDGKCAVTLSSSAFLSNTTLLREQTVDIVFSSTDGIRIPKNALRTETRQQTDEAGNVTGEFEVSGVYVLTGAQAEFRRVEVLWDDGDYFLVQSPEDTGKKSLRSGDEVIIASVALFDGKVVQ